MVVPSEQSVPDIQWSWNDQVIQEILSKQNWSPIQYEIYKAKNKWYHDKALFLAPLVSVGSRIICNFYYMNCLAIFLLYFVTLTCTVYKNQLSSRWPSHGYLRDMLSYWLGSTETLPYYAGRISDVATLFCNHFVIFYLSFIFVHVLCD